MEYKDTTGIGHTQHTHLYVYDRTCEDFFFHDMTEDIISRTQANTGLPSQLRTLSRCVCMSCLSPRQRTSGCKHTHNETSEDNVCMVKYVTYEGKWISFPCLTEDGTISISKQWIVDAKKFSIEIYFRSIYVDVLLISAYWTDGQLRSYSYMISNHQCAVADRRVRGGCESLYDKTQRRWEGI